MSEHPNEHFNNPLDSSPEREQRIRERAYYLWQSEGCLEGHDLEYWERARELEAIADHPEAGLIPIDSLDEPVDEAALQDNLGEFPDRQSDQGVHRPTPMTRQAARAASRDG